MSSEKENRFGLLLAIMASYFFIADIGAITPAMGVISQAYPNVSVGALGYLTSVVAIIQIPVAILCGVLVGRKIKYKTALVGSLFIFIVFGAAPAVLGDSLSFGMLLFLRAIFGIGIGSLYPLCNGCVIALYPDEGKRANVIGIGMAMFNIGAIIAMIGGGLLATKSWNFTFLFYALAIIPLFLSLIFFKEPEHQEELRKEKIKIPGIAYFYLVIYLVSNMLYMPFINYLAVAMGEAQMGDSALAGSLMALFAVAGVVVSLMLGIIYKVFKRYIFVVAAFLVGIGLYLIYAFTTPGSAAMLPMIIGILLLGIGQATYTAGMPMVLSMTVSPSAAAAAMGLTLSFMNIGSFLTTPYSQIVFGANPGGGTHFVYLVSAVLSIVFGFIILVVALKSNKNIHEKTTNTGQGA